MARRAWSHEELTVAFNLYCKIPFGRIHRSNPQVIELAKLFERTPSAVSWKLANFASLDPVLQKRNISGARHTSQADVEIWKEFNGNWETLSFESERLFQQMSGRPPLQIELSPIFPEGRTRESIVRIRVNQGFFRSAVLAAYGMRCCLTGLSIPQLLNASHIVPWSVDVKNRTNPRNGLCLNAIHDRAFDCGLLTVTRDMKAKLSPKVKEKSADEATQDFLWRYDGATISLPDRFVPDAEFLRYHNEQVFLKS
jgi:putative restriction endonuclease